MLPSMSNLDAASMSKEKASRASNKKSGTKNCLMKCIYKMRGLIILLLTIYPAMAFATDFGKQGQTFRIEEEPFVEMLRERLNGIDLEKEQQKIKKRVRERIENPPPVANVKPATKERTFYFDPSYILDKDAVLPCGTVLHKAGTRVNPLEHMDLSRRLFFIDSRHDNQISWLKDRLNHPTFQEKQKEQVEDRVILVAGSIFKLQELLGAEHAGKVYFDQNGELTKKFGIKGSPAIVEQEGFKLKIEEVMVN